MPMARNVELLLDGEAVWFLGHQLRGCSGTAEGEKCREALSEDLSALMLFTYRKGFAPIPRKGITRLTSDSGWGCMLRTGQMLLAQAFMRHFLPDWRRPVEEHKDRAMYVAIRTWFCDTLEAPYSIHNISLTGAKFGKEVGSWFGPTTTACVLRSLVEAHQYIHSLRPFHVHVAEHGALFLDVIQARLGETEHLAPSERPALLLLIPLMLGTARTINTSYIENVKRCFQFPQCVGIVGGRPRASLYFFGHHRDDLMYLDPHVTTQPALQSAAVYHGEMSTHEETFRLMPAQNIDPSALLGFYCRDPADLEHFVAESKRAFDHSPHALFSWQNSSMLAGIGAAGLGTGAAAGPDLELSDDEGFAVV